MIYHKIQITIKQDSYTKANESGEEAQKETMRLIKKNEIKMETFQYRKSRIWEMKEDKYTKSLAKNQVYATVHIRDIRKNVSPKFIKLCMETPCLCFLQGHKYGRPKPTETSVFEFSYLWVNSSFEELIKIKAMFILRQGMFR